MKKILIGIFIFTLMLLAGCGVEGAPVKIELKGEASVDLIVLVDEPNYAVNEMAKAFAAKLSEYTDKNVEVSELSEFIGKEDLYPIYIDTVNEDGSNLPDFSYHMSVAETDMITWVNAAIETYDRDCEIIYGKDSAQVIAPNEYMLYFALEEVLNGFKNENHFVFAGTRTLFGGDAIPTPAQLVEKVGDVQFLFTEYKVTFVYNSDEAQLEGNVLSVDGDGRDGMQGGGTDGTYAYYALYEDDVANIYKFDLDTWECVAVSEALPTGHSNDITYVPEKHVLMLSDCTERDGWAGVHYVDPDTLEYIEYGLLPSGFTAINYVPSTQQYVIMGGVYEIYDKDFNHIRTFNFGYPHDTTQGLYCDGSYIYDSRWGERDDETHSGQNRLLIHDMEGNFISHGEIHGDPYKNYSENENVFIHNNLFYVGYQNSPRTVNEYIMVPANMFE